LVLKQVGLEQEIRAAYKETKVLLHKIQEGEAETEWVRQDEKII
jgi:hypothetical protein